MARCENCGCGMSGGFCSNCHEEVFIAEQYSEMGEDVPASIAEAANKHMSDPNRLWQAAKIRAAEAQQREQASKEFWGEDE